MRVRLLLQLAALLLSLSVQTATASHVAVPADFASIQGAIDSHADTVLVAPGEYAEDLAVGQGVVLLSAPPPNCELNPPMPQVGRLTVTPLPYSGYSSNTVTVQQFEFRGQVVLPSQVSTPQLYVSFHSCEMDSGIAQGGYGPSDCAVAILIVDSCSVKGSSSLASATVEFTSNVVEGGG